MSDNNLFALVVEDDYDASIIFAKALQVLGCETEIIQTGDAALERLAERVPHIVLLDLHLPHVTGADILRKIRADERLVETLVIVASADPRMAETIKHHADLILIKPTTFSQVREFASRLIESRNRTKIRLATGEIPSSNNPAP